MKKSKILLFVLTLLAILIIFLICIVIKRYNIINNLENNNSQSKVKNNLYFSENIDTINTSYWKKDNITKIILTNTSNNVIRTYWNDSTNDENMTIYNNENKYSLNSESASIGLPSSLIFLEKSKFSLAMNFNIQISSINYNGKECYYISEKTKNYSYQEIIEKSSGIILYSYYDNCSNTEPSKTTLDYTFNTVTDEDVTKPDVTDYTQN